MAFSVPHRADPEVRVRQCREEVAARPKEAAARHALAVALCDAQDPGEAIEQCCRVLSLHPKQHATARLLASLVQRYALSDGIAVTEKAFEAALAFPDVDRQALCVAAISHLKSRSGFKRVLSLGRTENWNIAAAALLANASKPILQNRLFLTVLSLGVNTDIEMELLLTSFRRQLLLANRDALLRNRSVRAFACFLVQQCINNEYVFDAGASEWVALERLEFDESKFAAGDKHDIASLVLTALYKPLHSILAGGFLPDTLDQAVPKTLREILHRYFSMRHADREAECRLPQLTAITDATSKRVERQYAADPYPKWLSLHAPARGSSKTELRQYFQEAELTPLAARFQVLIAGCGTGQQAVQAALGYGPDAALLAIDLCRTSLAYADRMAAAFGAANIEFAQADILELDSLDRRFDVIECIGVLHHMADPYRAWRILVDRLRPGGLMLVGLYSAVSRGNILKLRDDPAHPGSDADDDALRAFRSELMRRPDDAPGGALKISQDFFVKSGFRDLALHVSEQHCSIPEIDDFLKTHGMTFHGFCLPPASLDAFCDEFPDDGFPGSLDNWREFELASPRTFDGMYVFWCRKS